MCNIIGLVDVALESEYDVALERTGKVQEEGK